MGHIHVLDDHIANQIAAGEVVERPASVVKELVENAVDAGSSAIDVWIEEGGLQLIRVKDNGAGMDDEDVERAFLRHATSKISSGRDLFAIRTLGFRGEALPSIAAVAKVECVTCDNPRGMGTRLRIEGGRIVEKTAAAAPQGTEIAVRDLFFNTPARLKYMKTIQTEFGHVSDYLYRMALAHPDIAFAVRNNGNLLFQTMGRGDMRQVIAAVYGTAAAKAMLPVQGDSLDYRMEGFTSAPDWTRANRTGITTIVNGRYIRHYGLVQALLQAYHTLLPINRYPLTVLRLEMEPALLDVNVHPSKLEVRFSKDRELMQFLEASLRRVLGRQVLIPKPGAGQGRPAAQPKPEQQRLDLRFARDSAAPALRGTIGGQAGQAPLRPQGTEEAPRSRQEPSAPAGTAPAARQGIRPPETESAKAERELADARDQAAAWASDTLPAAGEAGRRPPSVREPGAAPPYAEQPGMPSRPGNPEGRYGPRSAAQDRPPIPGRDRSSGNRRAPDSRYGAGNEAAEAGKPAAWSALYEPQEVRERPPFPNLYPVGQALGTYIVAQNEEGLFLIDQHAAHERIHFELFYERFGRPEPISQELLLPITLEFTPSDAAVLKGRMAHLEQAGIVMEPFGGNAFLIRSYPQWLPQGEEKALIEEICAWIIEEAKPADLAKLREKAAALCACKASIKANDSMTIPAMEALLSRLSACRNPYTCPHGRPIVISFSNYDLEKMFKRVM